MAQELKLDYVITGALEGDATTTTATASFVRLSADQYGTTATVVSAAGYTDGSVGYLAYDLAQKARQAFPPRGKVLLTLTDRRFLVDLSESDGLTVGAPLTVAEVEELRDADTGAVLDLRTRPVGQARVSGLNPKTAECSMLGTAAIRKGMTVVADPPSPEGPASLPLFRLIVGDLVVPAGEEDDPSLAGIAEIMTAELAGTNPNIQVLERQQRQQIVIEIQVGQGADLDWRTTVRAGQQWGANVIVVPVALKHNGEYRLYARLDDVSNSRLMVTDIFRGRDLAAPVTGVTASITALLQSFVPERVNAGALAAQINCPFARAPLPVGQYPCLDRLGADLLTWTLENSGEETCRVRVSVDLPGYSVASYTTELSLPPHSRKSIAGPTPRLDPAKLATLVQDATPAQVQCAVDLFGDTGSRKTLERSYPVQLLRPGIWMSPLKGIDAMPTLAMLARDSEALVAVRGEAAALTHSRTLPGYQTDALGQGAAAVSSAAGAVLVRERVAALYQVVPKRGGRYVEQSAISSAPAEAQRVLPPAQVLEGGRCQLPR